MTLAERALEIALSQEGVSESPKGSNGGPEVNQYLRSVGLGPGYAWCMAFVYWCVNKAAIELMVKNQLVKTGGVMYQYRTTKLRLLPVRSKSVRPGDIFIMEFPGGKGHTGFIINIKNGIAKTIEGNTNDDGSREGYEVAIRERPVTAFKAIIQLQ